MRFLRPSSLATSLTVILIGSLPLTAWSAIILPANNGFEAPDLGSGSYAFGYNDLVHVAGDPDLPASQALGWTFSGSTGIAANGSNFHVSGAGNENADGTTSAVGQAAFIQDGNGTLTSSVISQTLGGFTAGTASVSFWLEARPSVPGHSFGGNNPIDVKLDGIDLGTYEALSSQQFSLVTTPFVAVSAGSHTLYFIGTDPQLGDNTQFIDGVSVENVPGSTVPEPGSLVLFGLGLAILAVSKAVMTAKRRLGADYLGSVYTMEVVA